ncbi:MAG TPA: porin, partial [Nevskiaceae bacterium]|nr:porin [Nevskiaceae bacterium]
MQLGAWIYRGVAGASLTAFAAAAAAQDATTQDLEQRLRVVERQLEIQKEEAEARAKDSSQAVAGDKGFSLKSADGSYALNFKALVQADGRFYTGDPAAQGINDGFLLRRVEPTFQASLGKLVGVTFTPNFSAGSNSSPGVAVSDLFVEVKFDPAYTLRIGRYKTPVSGLENLQPSGAIRFIERGLPTSLAPNRDFGAQLQGALFGSTLSYAVGIFNGAADGRDAVPSDTDNRKEIAARIFAEPFKNSPGFFQGLGFGIAGSRGTKLGANTAVNGVNSVYQGYVTTGQQTFFNYAPSAPAGSATTVAFAGLETRIQPQLYFYRNSFGLLAEYSTSRQELTATNVAGAVTTVTGHDALTHKAYQ